jgi:hypothetical protein
VLSDALVFLEFDDRESDSPYVERIWRSRSRNGGSFLSMAEGNIELVVTRLPGFLAVTLRGPVSRGSLVECPPNGEWLAVRFRLGTYLPQMPTAALIDHQDVQLPVLPNGRFWFSDLTWEFRPMTTRRFSWLGWRAPASSRAAMQPMQPSKAMSTG